MKIQPLVDQPIEIPCPPGEVLYARAIDDAGNVWTSETRGERAMDWVITMRPQGAQTLFVKRTPDPILYTLKMGPQEMILQHHYLTDGVTFEERGEGRIYWPKEVAATCGVIVLNGSGGGRPDCRAALLASHGIPAYALPYFRFRSLPPTLERIPLEYFEKEIAHFAQDVKNVALLGTSKGGELALVLGTLFDINRIIAYVPSSATYGGFPNFTAPSWTYKGKDFPVAPIGNKGIPSHPLRATPFFLEEIHHIENARIPVERIPCPVLLISGEDDQMWPSTLFCQKIKEYLPQATHLSYPGAGHMLGPPYHPTSISTAIHPTDGNVYDMGGKMWAHADACVDSWQQTLAFLLN